MPSSMGQDSHFVRKALHLCRLGKKLHSVRKAEECLGAVGGRGPCGVTVGIRCRRTALSSTWPGQLVAAAEKEL